MGSPSTSTPGPQAEDTPGDSGPHRVRRLLLAILATLLLPILVVWRELLGIWSDSNSRNILIAAAWLIVAGTVIFTIVEDLSVLDGFYFSFITLATIGYGDIAPQTDLGKIITVLYAVAGLGVFGALIATITAQRKNRLGRRRSGSEDEAEEPD